MKRFAFSIPTLTLVVLLGGCLSTYVGDPDKAVLDPKFIGIWHKSENKSSELWAVHKLNAHNYLVQSYRFTTGDDDKPAFESSMTFRAWLAPIGGQTFVTLEIFDPASLLEPAEKNKDRYAVARVGLESDVMSIQGIDPNFLKGKDISTPAQLEKLIQDEMENKALYLETGKYKKITAATLPAVQPLIDLVK